MMRGTHLRWLALVALFAVLGIGQALGLTTTLASAASPSPAPSSSPGQVVLRLGWLEEPENLNPFAGYALPDYEIWSLNYSYLFGCGSRNQPTLDLATALPTVQNGGVSADGKVWTIHIRSGVKFQDGTPLTAEDVAFTYNYVIKNSVTRFLSLLPGIRGAKALSPTTVQLTFSHAVPTGYVEARTLPILPANIWKQASPKTATTAFGSKPPIVGSGPFEVTAWKKGSYIEMTRNPYYWDPKPTVDKIYFTTYQNATSMVADLKMGQLDGAYDIPVAEFKQLSTSPGIRTAAYDYYAWSYLEFNCGASSSSTGNPVLRDPAFRHAINYALDKQRLAAIDYNGFATPATTIITPDTWSNPDFHWQPSADQAYTYDPAKASQLLTAAGYPLRNGVRVNRQGQPIARPAHGQDDHRLA